MATSKPRLTITLDPDTYQLWKAYASAQGRSMGSVINEFLGEASPPVARALSVMLAARTAPREAASAIVDELELAAAELYFEAMEHGINGELFLDRIVNRIQAEELVAGASDASAVGRANPPSSNTGATTQPPTPKTPS